MRLTSLRLRRYGNFDDVVIPFDASPGVVNLVVAPNGAGKSVLRTAFCDLLFGIGGQSPMGFRHGYPNMRIVAEAVTREQETIVFGRRKGQGNTLIDAEGMALDPSVMAGLLGRTDRVRLERLFALDTERLRGGAEALLAADGELGAALASGAGAVRNPAAVRKRLAEMRDALAPKRKAGGRPFYVGLDQYVTARRAREQSVLKPDDWARLEADRAAAEARQAAHNQLAAEASAEIARLERIRRVRPLLSRLDAARAWLAANPDAPVLDGRLAERLQKAREGVVVVEDRARRAAETAAQSDTQWRAVTVDEALLAEAEAVERLHAESGAARKARADLPGVTAQAAEKAAAIAGYVRELGLDLPVERAGEAVPARGVVQAIRRLIQAYPALCEKAERAWPAAVARHRAERDQARQAMAALPATSDVSGLEALVREIRADGDPARMARDAAETEATARGRLAAAMAKVPGWRLDVAALGALAPLPVESYEDAAGALDAARGAVARLRDEAGKAVAARDAAADALARLVGAEPVPDEDGLRQARERRDQGWQLIYRRAFTPEPPTLEEEGAFSGGVPLALAYERAVAVADEIADRRVGDAELVALVATARTKLKDAVAALAVAEERLAAGVAGLASAEARWTALCAIFPLGEAPTLAGVRGFLKAREAAMDAQAAVIAAAGVTAALTVRHAGWADRLARAAEMPPGCAREKGDLAALLAAAEAALGRAREADKARAAREQQYAGAERALEEAERGLSEAVAALEAWRGAWARVMGELGRSADEDPVVAEGLLQVFDDLGKASVAHAALRERVAGMERDIAGFAADAAALTARLAPDLVPDLAAEDPFIAAGALHRRVLAQKAQAAERDALVRQAADAAHRRSVADGQLAEARAALAAALALIGAADAEAAVARLALAADRATWAGELAKAESGLVEQGDGYPEAALRAEAGAVSIEGLPGALDDARRRHREAQDAAQSAAGEAARLALSLRQAEQATGATDAAADQQAAVATMGRALEEALVCHVAGALLEQGIALAAQEAEPAMLRQISTLFCRLTGGTYTRVVTETEGETARLFLVQRDFPDERQAIGDLSEGTRDQLFLALRLAAVEGHAEMPLPFLGDDILQTFDDERAVAALDVLRGLSETVQVILLTHHAHVVGLAAGLPVGSVHIHRLGAAG